MDDMKRLAVCTSAGNFHSAPVVTPMGPRDIQSWVLQSSDNGDGSSVSFNDSGFAAIEVSFTSASGGGQGLFRVLVPEPTTGSLWWLALGFASVFRRRFV